MSKKRAFGLTLLAVAIAVVAGFAVTAGPSGSIHVNPSTSGGVGPNSVGNATGACNDSWAYFYYVPEDKLGNLGIRATDGNSQAHIDRHGGLDGFYDCAGGLCNVRLCAREGFYPFGGWNYSAD
ncbi:MAG: hypothetical protein AAF560_13810, partial [Acidobacteriota bacterium]